ncbi:MAG TPA: hypothetical protein VHV82_07905 [Sporichthyaceae bacterium]|jgi:hypothetical protein|nr:hypothetical protein [Sporichthyaceae bacterium]
MKRLIASAVLLGMWIASCAFLYRITPRSDWDDHIRCHYNVPGWHWQQSWSPQGGDGLD